MGCDLRGRGLLGIITIFPSHPAALTSTFPRAKIKTIVSGRSPSSVSLVLAQDDRDWVEERLREPFMVA